MPFYWSEIHQAAFEQIKELLIKTNPSFTQTWKQIYFVL